MAPVGPLGTTSKITVFIITSTVWSSWVPPGFSCPYLINYMKIIVFIDIVTPNGLLDFMIFSVSVQNPNIQKQRKHEFSFFHVYFHCFELLGSTDAHLVSNEIFKEIYRKRTCENIRNS